MVALWLCSIYKVMKVMWPAYGGRRSAVDIRLQATSTCWYDCKDPPPCCASSFTTNSVSESGMCVMPCTLQWMVFELPTPRNQRT